MANRYKQASNFAGITRFTRAPMSQVEFSSMTNDPTRYVPFNAGDIVPVDCFEVLPHSTYSIDLEYVIRQLSASVCPTMGELQYDIFAFYCQNRIVNDSWKNVLGENTSGYWSAPEVNLAPLVNKTSGTTKIPVGSLADLYGLPNQRPIPNVVLSQMNDLKIKQYLCIFNNYFRSQDYMPEIPFSKLNIFQGFLEEEGTTIELVPKPDGFGVGVLPSQTESDGGYDNGGAVVKAIFGDGSTNPNVLTGLTRVTSFSALGPPLKACKLHDPFTSVLPAPQKGPEVYFGIGNNATVAFDTADPSATDVFPSGFPLALHSKYGDLELGQTAPLYLNSISPNYGSVGVNVGKSEDGSMMLINGTNLVGTVDLSQATGISVNDLRTSIATQQVLELLARGGSRYWSFLKSFFGIETVNPFPDIPTQIGHLRRKMDLYQVAQTAPGGDSPQGSLTAFGYTATGGSMFTKTFLEHGYVHILAVVRRRPIYSTYIAPDNFRRNTLDFYLPQFANIGEQPIRLATLNPFKSDSMERAIGYQEAWWEYRYSPNTAVGILRSGLDESLDVWHYGDNVDFDFTHVNGEWLVDDTQEVLDRSLATTSELAPQFIGQFNFRVHKQLPMPVYSVPGLDQI